MASDISEGAALIEDGYSWSDGLGGPGCGSLRDVWETSPSRDAKASLMMDETLISLTLVTAADGVGCFGAPLVGLCLPDAAIRTLPPSSSEEDDILDAEFDELPANFEIADADAPKAFSYDAFFHRRPRRFL